MQQWSLSLLEGLCTPQRENASVVHDPISQRLFMFGGCDQSGSATDTLFCLDLATFPNSSWQLVKCTGSNPKARWGCGSCITDNKLWVFGGFAKAASLTDLHCLDLKTSRWSTVTQSGCMPNRAFGSSKQKTFQAAVASTEGILFAFGREAQDENLDPGKPAGVAAELMLHAMDLTSSTTIWQHVPTQGLIKFEHLEALLIHDRALLAVGWNTAPPGVKADCYMQVCRLDLDAVTTSRSTPFSHSALKAAPTWTQVPAKGSIPIARVGCAACVLPSQQPMLVLHGGMLCSQSVQGRLTQDTLCLDLTSMTWTRLQPTSEKLLNSNKLNLPRVSHTAVPLPGDRAVLLVGGTSTRHSHASVSTIECLRQVQEMQSTAIPGVSPTKASQNRFQSYLMAAAAETAAQTGIEKVLSSTPGLIAIGPGTEPFAQLYNSTPMAAGAVPAAVTPAVHATPRLACSSPFVGHLGCTLVPPYDFTSYCCQEALSDVELVAGGMSFPAHKLLLCAQSPNLAQLLQKVEVRLLRLNDIYPDVLRLMLRYMYGGLHSIPVEAAPALFTASVRYGLPGLRAACLSVLVASISFETVTSYILLAHDHKCGELTQACVVYAAATFERLQQVLNTPGFLHLNKTKPQVGAMFVQMAMQYMAARR